MSPTSLPTRALSVSQGCVIYIPALLLMFLLRHPFFWRTVILTHGGGGLVIHLLVSPVQTQLSLQVTLEGVLRMASLEGAHPVSP